MKVSTPRPPLCWQSGGDESGPWDPEGIIGVSALLTGFRGRWGTEWQSHRDKHSQHHLHMSGLHLDHSLMLYRYVCKEVSECGHADTGGGGICVYVCSYIVHLLSGLLNDIKTGSGKFWKRNRMVGLTSSERGTCVELLERGHLFPTCIFLFSTVVVGRSCFLLMFT